MTPSPENDARGEKTDWRQACQILRDQGHYDPALAICRRAWPQWQSFEHAARVIRAASRNTDKDSPQYRPWLLRLYTLAAQASFLHDKVDGIPEPARQLLTRGSDPQEIEKFDMPWSQIGYRELRLLTRSDCKQLVAILGEPDMHQSARFFHGKPLLTSTP